MTTHAVVHETIPEFGCKPYLHLVTPAGTCVALPAEFAAKPGDVCAVLSRAEWRRIVAEREVGVPE